MDQPLWILIWTVFILLFFSLNSTSFSFLTTLSVRLYIYILFFIFNFYSLLREDGTPGVYLFRKGSDGVSKFVFIFNLLLYGITYLLLTSSLTAINCCWHRAVTAIANHICVLSHCSSVKFICCEVGVLKNMLLQCFDLMVFLHRYHYCGERYEQNK